MTIFTKLFGFLFGILIFLFVNQIYCDDVFVNPIGEGQDPWVIKTDSCYYSCSTLSNAEIVIWKSKRLSYPGDRRIVWTPPQNAWNSKDIWAPELHCIKGVWYIYYTAGSGSEMYNGMGIFKTQRAGVLECDSQNPQKGNWIDRGMLYCGDDIENWDGSAEQNIWSIDPTPLEYKGKLYTLWSGWDSTINYDNHGFTIQSIFIAEMLNPYTSKSNRVKIATPEYPWEFGRVQTVNEGPQILKNGEKLFCIYSGPDFWLTEYKMGLLELLSNTNPMEKENWIKNPEPVFTGTDEVYSVGHGSFTQSPDGQENWLMYRSKQEAQGGAKRDIRLKKFIWNADGTPDFGIPEVAGTRLILPSGEEPYKTGTQFMDDFNSGNWDKWAYYGWEKNIQNPDGSIHLGNSNYIYGGDKLLIEDLLWEDMTFSVDIKVMYNSGSAGIVFGTEVPGFGKYRMEGFYIGLSLKNQTIFLSRIEKDSEKILIQKDITFQAGQWVHLELIKDKRTIRIFIDDVMYINSDILVEHKGFTGLRIDNTFAIYDNVSVHSSRIEHKILIRKKNPRKKKSIAVKSTISASHIWKYDNLTALNDQLSSNNSADTRIPRYTAWDHKGTNEWLIYEFDKKYKIHSVEIFWFDDSIRNGACRVPKSWELDYYKNGKWIPVNLINNSEYRTQTNKKNQVIFEKVKTDKIRLRIELQKSFSSGILEWIVK